MNLLLAVLVVLVFAILLARLRVGRLTRQVVNQGQKGFAILRDPALEDAEKEEALQRSALRLFGLFGAITGLSVTALVLPLGGIWLMQRVGIASLDGVLIILERWDFLLGATVLGTATYYMSRVSDRG